MPLSGTPVRGKTNLQLLVASRPPFRLFVDARKVTITHDVKFKQDDTVAVEAVLGHAAVIVQRRGPSVRLYGLPAASRRSVDLGAAVSFAAATDTDAAWIIRRSASSACTIRKVALDGRVLVRSRPFPCATTLESGGASALVVNRSVVIGPETGRVLFDASRGARIVAATSHSILVVDPANVLRLHDVGTGYVRELQWPSTLPGIGEGTLSPDGRFAVIAFGNPALNGGPQQALDLWMLDTKTGAFTHLPDMPAIVSLKRTSMAWTDDRRLVLLANSRERDMIAIWAPGKRRLAVKRISMPQRTGGANSIAVVD